MDESFLASRRAAQAKQSAAADAMLDRPGIPAYAERIASQPRSSYALPRFLKKTASLTQQQQLKEIRDDLWALNEEYVGERTWDAQVSVCLTGRSQPLRDRLMGWCRSYIDRRLEQPNPKDRGDPFLQYNRLWFDELGPIFHPHLDDSSSGGQTGSLDFVIVAECQSYAAWLLYEGTFKGLVISWQWNGETLIESDRPVNQEMCDRVVAIVKGLGLHQDSLGKFLKAVRESGDAVKLSEISRRESSDILDELKRLALDIQEMHPYLVRNFDPAKSLVEVGRGFVLAWEWTVQYGVANVLGAGTPTAALEAIRSRKAKYLVKLAPDGRLLDATKPWIGTGSSESREVRAGLPENI